MLPTIIGSRFHAHALLHMRSAGVLGTICSALLLIAVSAAHPREAPAQQSGPTIRSLLTGYGAVGFGTSVEDGVDSDFSAFMSLVPLFQVGEDLLVDGEFEFTLHGTETLAALQHAQIHYLGFERVQLKAGRFNLPFGVWRHTNWVNRMPTPPLLYEDAHGEPATAALIPILFDLGAMAGWNVPLAAGWRTTVDFWVTQGPRIAAGVEHHGADSAPAENLRFSVSPAPSNGTSIVPAVAFGSNFEDNNPNKMVGTRLRGVSAWGLTLQGSAFRAAYDDAGELDISGMNLSAIWAPGSDPQPLFDLRGEWVLIDQEYEEHHQVESVKYGGYYTQISRQIGAIEPVFRWSHLQEAEVSDAVFREERRQLAVGLNYWISPSVPLKVAYHWEADGADGFFLEWAAGF